jgi:xylose isomerase
MLVILRAGGVQGGGINFDAKTRRNSTDLADIFYGHIGGMDLFARALIIANEILQHSRLPQLLTERYDSFTQGDGLCFTQGKLNLEFLATHAHTHGEPMKRSGKQELFENIINQYMR